MNIFKWPVHLAYTYSNRWEWIFASLIRSCECKAWMKSILCTNSIDDSGGQRGTRWNSRWASPAGHSRCGSLRSASPSSPEAPPLSVALGSLGSCALWNINENRLELNILQNTEVSQPRDRSKWNLTLLCLLLLLFDLIGDDGKLSLKLSGRGVSASKVVERLPGAPQGADEALLQVGAHPGETLLQLWKNRQRDPSQRHLQRLTSQAWLFKVPPHIIQTEAITGIPARVQPCRGDLNMITLRFVLKIQQIRSLFSQLLI